MALKQALQPEFKEYGAAVVANARVMAKAFMEKGYSIATGQLKKFLLKYLCLHD